MSNLYLPLLVSGRTVRPACRSNLIPVVGQGQRRSFFLTPALLFLTLFMMGWQFLSKKP